MLGDAGVVRAVAFTEGGSAGSGATASISVIVHQASRMCMEYLNCSGLQAFETLVRLSTAKARAVSDVSNEIVKRPSQIAMTTARRAPAAEPFDCRCRLADHEYNECRDDGRQCHSGRPRPAQRGGIR